MYLKTVLNQKPGLTSDNGELYLQQMGLSKQSQNAIKKVRQVEDEARKQRLAQLDMTSSGNLIEPLLDRT